jgi:hypothetical protein
MVETTSAMPLVAVEKRASMAAGSRASAAV